MAHELRLYLDAFDAKSAAAPLPAVPGRAVYVLEGALAFRDAANGATAMTLGANAAAAASGACALGGGSLATRALRWELVLASVPQQPLVPAASESRLLLAAPMVLAAERPYLLRCDRVDFPPGGEALTHTHQGGGIRCLLSGSIRIETQGHTHGYGPLGAWYEAGPDPVYAAADAQVPSAFARCMVLPGALLGGQSSIKYVNPEDLAKPKSQRYQVFVDQPIDLRTGTAPAS